MIFHKAVFLGLVLSVMAGPAMADSSPADVPIWNLAFKKVAAPVSFMGGFVDQAKCERSRAILQRDLNKHSLGKAFCLGSLAQ